MQRPPLYALDEVRAELGFLDLVATNDPDERIVWRLLRALPKVYERSASRWSKTANRLADALAALRVAENAGERRELLNGLRDGARDAHSVADLGW